MLRWLGQLPPWLLLLLCVLYVLSPVDFFPDFLGVPGRFDDLLVVIGTLYCLYSASRKIAGADGARREHASRAGREDQGSEGGSRQGPSRKTPPGTKDPYDVLGAGREESLEEIRRRYREKLLQYHPDRVQHLGREFQEMAERKTKEITEAFRKISTERGKG